MRPMRRKDKQMPQAEAAGMLESAQHGVLCTVGEQGPYGVPISYVFDGGSIYFHSAVSGHKIDNICYDPRACFTVMENGNPLHKDHDFMLPYRSVVAFGKLSMVEDEAEKRAALDKLIHKYVNVPVSEAADYIVGNLVRTAVLKFTIEEFSGKESHSDCL